MRLNFLLLSAGTLLAGASQWGALVVLAKLTDATVVGEYALAVAICTPVVMFARLGMREVKATDTASDNPFGLFLALTMLLAAAALAVIMAVAGWVATGPATAAVIAVMGLGLVADLHSQMLYGLFQAQERHDFQARSLALRAALSLALLTAGVALTGSLLIGVAGQAAARLLVLCLHDLPIARRRAHLGHAHDRRGQVQAAAEAAEALRPLWQPRQLLQLAWLGLPLGLVALLAALYQYVPRYVVAERLGLEPLGHFAAMVILVLAPMRLVNALGATVVPRLAGHHAAAGGARFLRLLARTGLVALAFGAAGVLVIALAGGPILELVYAPDYARHADAFTIIMVAAAIRYLGMQLQYGVVATRRFWALVAQNAVVVLVAVAASLLLIGADDLRGAAWAMVIVFTTHLLIVLLALTWSLWVQRRPDAEPVPS